MWIEIMKDFLPVFLVVWLVYSPISTILYLPFKMVSHFSPYQISTTTKRLLTLSSLLLVVALSLLLRSGLELVWNWWHQPLNPPLELDLNRF